MHDGFSFVSLKRHLQWKLRSVLRAPSILPSPADPQCFPGWTRRAGQHPEFPETAPAEDLGESQQTGTGLPYVSIPSPCPGAAMLGLLLPCERLVATCIALPLLLSHHVPRGWLSPAFLLALHVMNQLRGPGRRQGKSSSAVKIILNKKIAGLINGSISPRPRCWCFAELRGVSRGRGDATD